MEKTYIFKVRMCWHFYL